MADMNDWQPVAPPGGDDWAPVAQPPTWAQSGMDAVKQLPGIAMDTASGIGGAYTDLSNLASTGVIKGLHALGVPGTETPDAATVQKLKELFTAGPHTLPSDVPAPPGSQQIQSAIEGVTGAPPDPTTQTGKYTRTIGDFMGGAAAGDGPLIARLIKWGVLPGAATEGAGQLADAAGASPGTKGAVQLAASLAAPVVGGRAITLLPNKSASHAADIAALTGDGVRSTAGQAVDSDTMRTIESVLASSKINEQQGKQITRAAFQRVGMDVPDGMQRGSGGTIDRLMTDAGSAYDGIAARNSFRLDGQGATELNGINTKYAYPGPYTPDTTNAITGTLTRVRDLLQAGVPGKIDGPDYIALRSNIRAAARNADPQRAEGLNDIVNAMDSAFERNLPANSPDAGALPAANQRYRDALVLQHAAAAAGTDTGKGILTPGNIAAAAKAVYGKGQYVRGQDNFSDLAGPAVASLAKIPDSGTAKRAAVIAGLGTVGGAAGYALGSKYSTDQGNDSPIGGLLLGESGGTGLLAAALARPLLMNRLSQAYLKNQAMTHTPGLFSLPAALTAEQGSKGLLSP